MAGTHSLGCNKRQTTTTTITIIYKMLWFHFAKGHILIKTESITPIHKNILSSKGDIDEILVNLIQNSFECLFLSVLPEQFNFS